MKKKMLLMFSLNKKIHLKFHLGFELLVTSTLTIEEIRVVKKGGGPRGTISATAAMESSRDTVEFSRKKAF